MLLQANFLTNAPSVSGGSPALRLSRSSSRSGCVVVKVSTGTNGRPGDPNAVVLTESDKAGGGEAVVAPSAADLNSKSTVATGGVRDVYGEDFATEDQHVTPWTVTVASV